MGKIISIIIFFTLVFFSSGAFSQRIISALSDRQISIDSGFTGETITIFGNIEPAIGSSEKYVEGTYSIAIIIEGPKQNRVVRKKNKKFGVWLNSEQMVFKKIPSYYWLIANERIKNFSSQGFFSNANLLPQNQPAIVEVSPNNQNVETRQLFSKELVRLMEQKGLFGINENGVRFHSNTLYSVKIKLPSDVPVGPFLATTYLFKDGNIIDQRSEGFSVRKTGVEKLLGTSAKQFPFAYGVFTVILALFTGWLGGVAFRR